jgi:hypothetical protein
MLIEEQNWHGECRGAYAQDGSGEIFMAVAVSKTRNHWRALGDPQCGIHDTKYGKTIAVHSFGFLA